MHHQFPFEHGLYTENKETAPLESAGNNGNYAIVSEIADIFRHALTYPDKDIILPSSLRENADLTSLLNDLKDISLFALSLANGDTSKELRVKGFMAGALKTLRSHLRHMTWQTKQVTEGDYSQQMDFLGEFSEAFNAMVVQLEETRTKLLESEQKYRLLAVTDPLTGLFNRRSFFDSARKELNRTERRGGSVSFLMIDADHFKNINDAHGHACGDIVLRALGLFISDSIREEDLLARYGGEEFVVILPDTSEKEAVHVAERMRESLSNTKIPIGPCEVNIAISIGVYEYKGQGQTAKLCDKDVDQVVCNADKALYKAKESGRNMVCSFSLL
ncbi:GGDEF domain-containing protein [Desulfovibrio gilichinskyi]|uniref:diguanylate cyclase n=1 Tax=Desulfovibrio gilichinskyi TaxID=1519643 RepID=A0A1X7C240_9BACT|nr:GGDEF domain-containing protein [Desulfovibrio gilichinskyi]SME88438.1 diguanylate cyclase (GGDEF) domain-containing protein [Desulfovibrio gilichinskyi]